MRSRTQILIAFFSAMAVLPSITGHSGLIYFGGAVVLGAGVLFYAARLMNPPDEYFAMRVFKYSVIYLMALFAFLLADHWLLRFSPAMSFSSI